MFCFSGFFQGIAENSDRVFPDFQTFPVPDAGRVPCSFRLPESGYVYPE